ncbi:M949_RS01915 family surface polysaccharide biosynthesis protein [Buttiauxella ferragutiae]|uniref:M949_RS01915 family surface polysaccharide biosynthesis protein n=1 Tax=Buttiauxella ferragutiae TaxID=82989 RepID=UPI001F53C469|nr:hypothetical protein [Buttiauxella ferragutiae]UNK62706.1 hypothetical protein MNO13_07215 [Buttiauxella ferragutiae]
MKKNTLIVIIFCLTWPVLNAFASDAVDVKYKINWRSGSENYQSMAIVKKNELMVYSDNLNKKTRLWSFKDGVYDCPVDVVLEVVEKSLEAVDLFKNGDSVVLFAYRIGCVGDPSPVDFNYFAYYKGVQYSLRGSETIIFDGQPMLRDDDKGPQPDSNLKNQPLIYKYMLSKWSQISTTQN